MINKADFVITRQDRGSHSGSRKNNNLLNHSNERVKDTKWAGDEKPYLPVPFKRGTTSGETHFLYTLAKRFANGNVAELGVLHGGNTVVLGRGMQNGNLYAVDLFELFADSEKNHMKKVPQLIKDYFKEQKLTVNLQIIKSDTSTYGCETVSKFDFVFIDGDHSYEGCKKDWNVWSDNIKQGGVVAFHDCNIEGVAEVIDSIDLNKWEFEDHVYSIKSFRKL